MKTIRWVIAHEPIDLFLRAAERFKAQVLEQTNGALDIEILSLTEYSNKYNNGEKVTKHDLLRLMEEGVVEASQMYTTWLGDWNKDMYALDMPFLFRDHDHADKVLEGEIGQSLLDGLKAQSPVQGLAFTYSGGYRVIPSEKELDTVAAFRGMNIRTSKSPVAVDTFKALGANVVDSVELEEMNEAHSAGIIDGGESTYVRVLPLKQAEQFGTVNDTAHSLFLTSIIVGKEFYAGLDENTQKVLKDAALDAARLERKESVEQIDGIVDQCKAQGIKIVKMAEDETVKFKQATAHLYDKYMTVFSDNIIKKIQDA